MPTCLKTFFCLSVFFLPYFTFIGHRKEEDDDYEKQNGESVHYI